MTAHDATTTLFISRFTFPNRVFYEKKLVAYPGESTSMYIPAPGGQSDVMYCSTKADGEGKSTVDYECTKGVGLSPPEEPQDPNVPIGMFM